MGGLGEMFPRRVDGRALVQRMRDEIARRPAISVYTNAEVVAKSGSYGNYQVVIRAGDDRMEITVGQIIVATGFDVYEPEAGEFGYGSPGVVTLAEFRKIAGRDGWADPPGRQAGSPASPTSTASAAAEADRAYCSRYCCSAAVHASLLVADRDPTVRQYHLYRDMRTYGRNEVMFTESRKRGSLYLRFADDDPPTVATGGDGIRVTVHDLLTAGAELTIAADLLVLVTGMVPRQNDALISVLKLPIGRDGFLNEIHPKLRPVETVVDGVLIAGACQSPKTSAESVGSGLAAATQAAAVLKRGVALLDPQVAIVISEAACDGCGDCVAACPFGAISLDGNDGSRLADDRGSRLQGLRRLHTGLPDRRDRPAGLHRCPGQGDDRGPPRRERAMTRDIREVIRDEPLMRDRLLELLAGRAADGPGAGRRRAACRRPR